ncbi:MAG: hypothetical protein AB1921_16460 [Thermodesulfobacteriota bacterium]
MADEVTPLFGCGRGFRETLSDFAADFGSGRADVAMLAWRTTDPDGNVQMHFNWFSQDDLVRALYCLGLAEWVKSRILEFINQG